MSNFEVYDADVQDFEIRHSLIDIRYSKSGILPHFVYMQKNQ
jgi:hypothetical protein